ncbi:MAG TPA: AI-2E family transporter [Microbacteriaceae bacterium]|nr:AI-2E family transporter [Microbacteriaceae bacterium]
MARLFGARRAKHTAPVEAPSAAEAPPVLLPPARRGPLARGYLSALGVIGAVLTGLAIFGLRGIVASIFIALFAAVALDPLVRWFQRRGVHRTWSVVIVILLILVLLVTLIWVVVPLVIGELGRLIAWIPAGIAHLHAEGWFDPANQMSNGILGAFLGWIAATVGDPTFWMVVGGGVVGLGFSIATGIASTFFTAVLTIYFVSTFEPTKQAAYKLVAASRRPAITNYTERILENFGNYLSGMVVLAFLNALFSTILLLIVGVPGAFLLGLLALVITIIPLIGTVLTTAVMSVIAFIHDPFSGLIVLVLMVIYMQIEAYVLGPRIMGKAVQVPGSVVLISALAGGTLFGLIGALVAIPISAGIMLVIREVVIPRKDLA